MSKIYDKYLELKKENNNVLYLFRCGKFYIFIADDCEKINDYVVLKKVKFTNDCYKCGFPSNSLDSYMKVFNNHKLNIKIIEQIENNKVYELINKIDIDNITPLEAINKLNELKGLIK